MESGIQDGEDAALLKAGTPAALARFWERHRREAHRVAILVTRDPAAAEEAMQEAWLGLMRGLGTFDPVRGTARAWFLSILRHKAADLARGRRGAPLSLDLELPGAQGATLGSLLASPGEAPEEAARRREETAALLEALEGLPGSHREAVTLRWILGWDDRMMAQTWGVSPETARQRAHRGFLALKEALAGTSRSRTARGDEGRGT